MAKNAFRRHHAKRLLNKWNKELKHYDYMKDHITLSFGKIYSKDPFDCGRSNCKICGFHKNYKSPRIRENIPYHNDVNEFFQFY